LGKKPPEQSLGLGIRRSALRFGKHLHVSTITSSKVWANKGIVLPNFVFRKCRLVCLAPWFGLLLVEKQMFGSMDYKFNRGKKYLYSTSELPVGRLSAYYFAYN
jgi:hypothetical protein